MLRTLKIKLKLDDSSTKMLRNIQQEYSNCCNEIVKYVTKHRELNKVKLQHLAYYDIKKITPLSAQYKIRAIAKVSDVYKSQKALKRLKKNEAFPIVKFKKDSIDIDKHLYSIKGNTISISSLEKRKRISATMIMSDYHNERLKNGVMKQATLNYIKGEWYFNVSIEYDEVDVVKKSDKVMGVDVGENNIAATSSGTIYGGNKLKHQRDKYLGLRKRLQSNGSQSAKQKLRKISGKEARHVKSINHKISKQVVKCAKHSGMKVIAMEDLTNIRDNIKAGKRVRSRLHRWSFRQLQTFIEYKAQEEGIQVKYINPKYTSKTCYNCGAIGNRKQHKFSCRKCGTETHADYNASLNIVLVAKDKPLVKGGVNTPTVEQTANSC